ncbi:MAG: Na+/H+ antiporter NhaC [Kordiimonadaceae bacterium]|jgi:Na+:H+ antiporter, NhaC family|nr:Na+/H+ antiporter NhaC [Kordiimonadaceae bacterium]MBT6032620.1 Na+/H+ antiporter NhaC [Kordiimonadaceae bacterium]MBT6467657.1 Na+/H+ antiporter NhaC [Kordiimonadaceae bacterium]
MEQSNDEGAEHKGPSILVSLIPIVFLIGLMTLNLFLENAYVPSEMILFVSAVIAGLVAVFLVNVPYKNLEEGILKSIDMAMQANLIMLLVGALIAIWIASGIVPTLIYYGLEIISPNAFLTICCISCGIVAVCTGSSWSTIGTVGLALIGVGTVMGINPGLVAGAIISGAYFGDKMSPVSDSTNLAPAMVGTDVITHIKHMIYTTGPAIVISLLIFMTIDIFYPPPSLDITEIEKLQNIISLNFNVSLWLLIAPAAVVIFVARGLPAMPALILGIFLAIIAVPLFQWTFLTAAIENGVTLSGSYSLILNIIASGFSIESGDVMTDQLFNRGGMSSMLNVVFLVLAAMSFGGIMEASGMLQTLAGASISRVKSIGGLVASTLASCVFVNFTAANQSMAIIIPARMFSSAYKKFGLHPKTLSRAVEDAGTVTAPLIPWNTNAVFCTTALGVATIDYLPYVFFAFISPMVSLYLAYTDKTMTRIEEEPETIINH